nr:hypothetical protein [Halovivax ruber]
MRIDERGIGRRTLAVAQDKDGLMPVAACDRSGVAIDHGERDVEELLAATEGNVASGPTGDEAGADGGTSMDDGAASAVDEPKFRCGRFLP